MFTRKLDKFYAVLLVIALSFGISNADDYLDVKTYINNMRNATTNPGILGDVFIKVFDEEGKIKEGFLNFVNTATNGYIPVWKNNELLDSPLYSTGGLVGIGITTLTEKLNINGGLSITKDPDSGDDVGNRDYNDTRYEEAQNLLPVDEWVVGVGTVSIFSANGTAGENSRIWGLNPFGERAIIWESSPDSTSNADGGWNADIDIVDTKSYRSTIWIKKTGSIGGTSYFGAHSSYTDNLDGTQNTNPYFWNGDLPELDKWYLLVSYIHGSADTDTNSYGGIYDGVTGQKISSIIDFRNRAGATIQRHRAYLYYDTNTTDRQYFWGARFEEINGDEPTVESLLGIKGNIYQKRVSGICLEGESIRVINDDGTVICEVDDSVAVNTTNYITRSDGTNLIDSSIYQSGALVGIGTTTPSVEFEVAGDARANSLSTLCIGNCGTAYPAIVGTDSIVSGNLEVSGNITTSDPTNGNEVATKNYVDGAMPSGAVMPFNLAACPTGWIAADGTNGTPDLRGEFIRGLDNGRGVDASRTLASYQAQDWKGFYMTDTLQNASSGYSHGPVDMGKSTTAYIGKLFTGHRANPSASIGTKWDTSEIRPRNVALLYCVKN